MFSNGKMDRPRGRGWRYRTNTSDSKKLKFFRPSRLSPLDLNPEYEVRRGVNGDCSIQGGCGRLFDAHGFAPCIFSGAIGRLLGIDPYSAQPVLRGNPEICKHCPYSMGRKQMWKLFEEARKLGYPPTETFAKVFEDVKNGKKLIEFTRFEDRL